MRSKRQPRLAVLDILSNGTEHGCFILLPESKELRNYPWIRDSRLTSLIRYRGFGGVAGTVGEGSGRFVAVAITGGWAGSEMG